jgi:hypothetical protein
MASRRAFATRAIISLGLSDRKLTDTRPVRIKKSPQRVVAAAAIIIERR